MNTQGFQNAPGVTAFAVGMRVRRAGEWLIVRWVDNGGDAHCQPDPDDGLQRCLDRCEIPDSILDLDSVWVGRKYICSNNPNQVMTVLARTSDQVGYGNAAFSQCVLIDDFRRMYMALLEPVPEKPTVDLCYTCYRGARCLMARVPGCRQCNMYRHASASTKALPLLIPAPEPAYISEKPAAYSAPVEQMVSPQAQWKPGDKCKCYGERWEIAALWHGIAFLVPFGRDGESTTAAVDCLKRLSPDLEASHE